MNWYRVAVFVLVSLVLLWLGVVFVTSMLQGLQMK